MLNGNHALWNVFRHFVCNRNYAWSQPSAANLILLNWFPNKVLLWRSWCCRGEQNSQYEGSIALQLLNTKDRWNSLGQASINSRSLYMGFCYFTRLEAPENLLFFFSQSLHSWFLLHESFYFQPWIQSPDKDLTFLFFFLLFWDCFYLTEYWFQFMISDSQKKEYDFIAIFMCLKWTASADNKLGQAYIWKTELWAIFFPQKHCK